MDEDQRAAVRSELVGFVFQSFQLLPALTALENVMLPLELKRSPAARRGALEYLQRVGLGHRLNHYPRQLSGGEQQRVAIARAFATRPRILFADEPTGNLDLKTGQHIIDLLFELNRDMGATLVLVTHDQGLTGRCAVHFELLDGATLTCSRGASAAPVPRLARRRYRHPAGGAGAGGGHRHRGGAVQRAPGQRHRRAQRRHARGRPGAAEPATPGPVPAGPG